MNTCTRMLTVHQTNVPSYRCVWAKPPTHPETKPTQWATAALDIIKTVNMPSTTAKQQIKT